MIDQKLFIGMTRFSVVLPGASDWHSGNTGVPVEKYMERLFAPRRMGTRMRIFSEWLVPALSRAFSGRRLIFGVFVSESLPASHRSVLEELALLYPFLRIVIVRQDATDLWDEFNTWLDNVISAEVGVPVHETPFAWFRVDDDDVLSDYYAERVERFVSVDMAGCAVTLPGGASAYYEDGKLYEVRQLVQAKTSQGQLFIGKVVPGSGQIIAVRGGVSHAEVDKVAPVILDRTWGPAWMMVRHMDQDSQVNIQRGWSPALKRGMILRDLRKHEALSLDALSVAMPDVAEVVQSSATDLEFEEVMYAGNALIPGKGLTFKVEPTVGPDFVVECRVNGAPTGAADSLVLTPGLDVEDVQADLLGGDYVEFEDVRVGYGVMLNSGVGQKTSTIGFRVPAGRHLVKIRIVPVVSQRDDQVLERLTLRNVGGAFGS